MGAYIYKAKVEKFLDGKIGFYDFWYKPYNCNNPPKHQIMRENIADAFIDRHEDGVQYACTVGKWGVPMTLYKVPRHLPVVVNDESKLYYETFAVDNIIGEIRGTKNGKKHFSKEISTPKEEAYTIF